MSSGKFAKATEEARRYSEKHDVERLVTQMVNMVVTVKPRDPKAHMIRWLLERCDHQQKRSLKVHIYKDLPVTKRGPAGAAHA
mmetsp:Transcript_50540/g.101688  ORF Transcript_50540/g.101688 Transcript_50540/m.101688 type:complete len:83 (-) Transcript_50540:45-293(-)